MKKNGFLLSLLLIILSMVFSNMALAEENNHEPVLIDSLEPIVNSIYEHDYDRFVRLMETGTISINSHTNKLSLLQLAVRLRDISILEYISKHPSLLPNLNYNSYNNTFPSAGMIVGTTQYIYSCRFAEIIAQIPNIKVTLGDEVEDHGPLADAFYSNRTCFAKAYLKVEDADVNEMVTIKLSKPNIGQRSLLSLAVIHENIELVKELLKSDKLEPNRRDTYRDDDFGYSRGTPLIYAVKTANIEMVKLLLTDIRIDQSLTDLEEGFTAKEWARQLNFKEIYNLFEI